jgi:hypothetical protein
MKFLNIPFFSLSLLLKPETPHCGVDPQDAPSEIRKASGNGTFRPMNEPSPCDLLLLCGLEGPHLNPCS